MPAVPDWSSTTVRILAALASVALALGLLGGGRTPVAVDLIPPPWDKLAHLAVFAAATILLSVSFDARRLAGAAMAVTLAVGLAVADEWQQLYLPGRSAGWDDLVADVAGVLIGLVAARALLHGAPGVARTAR